MPLPAYSASSSRSCTAWRLPLNCRSCASPTILPAAIAQLAQLVQPLPLSCPAIVATPRPFHTIYRVSQTDWTSVTTATAWAHSFTGLSQLQELTCVQRLDGSCCLCTCISAMSRLG